MKRNYLVYENMYIKAREAGWEGWGGNARLANAELVDRFFGLNEVPLKGRLLELGCGEGHHCRLFSKHGYEVTGIDISSTAISWACEKSVATGIHGKFQVADLTDISLEIPEKYNVVIDGNCLHCIIGNDRFTFLGHVFNVLVSGGVFFVSSLCTKDEKNHQIFKDNFPYRHVTSVGNLVSELEYVGFKVIKTYIYEREEFNHITVHAIKLF
jgi:2-polyprenyl-3-methyl-5-hydroxy-6-metoxy-1,4-benzoquinol methylase